MLRRATSSWIGWVSTACLSLDFCSSVAYWPSSTSRRSFADPRTPLMANEPRKPWLGIVGGSAIAIATLLTTYSEGEVYKAYPDPATHAAPWTICNGHTRGVKKG